MIKMSCIHPFGHDNSTRIMFGKPWFCLVFEPFVILNGPIFKALSALRGAKIAQRGLKMGSFHLFVHPNSPKVSLEKHIFDSFLTNFWSQGMSGFHFPGGGGGSIDRPHSH